MLLQLHIYLLSPNFRLSKRNGHSCSVVNVGISDFSVDRCAVSGNVAAACWTVAEQRVNSCQQTFVFAV
jgi:hypothetical protein